MITVQELMDALGTYDTAIKRAKITSLSVYDKEAFLHLVLTNGEKGMIEFIRQEFSHYYSKKDE